MADIEKVIQGIEVCLQDDGCTPCPYYRRENDYFCGVTDIMRDTLELLKELKENNIRLDKENQKLVEQMAQQPQIVRCGECKHWDIGHSEECDNSDSVCFHNGRCKPDWFCADGENK